MTPRQREALAKHMAQNVVDAAGPLPVVIVCDDAAVRTWASQQDLTVCWSPGLGLDGAVEAGVALAESNGAERIIVAHSDLPLAANFEHLLSIDGVVIVPDRRLDGTNVIVIPPSQGFRFAYGPGSFGRHHQEAIRLGLEVSVLNDEHLNWDVDIPDDLHLPGGRSLLEEVRN